MDSHQIDFLRSVHSLLFYHQSIGVDNYPADGAVVRFLAAKESRDEPSVACNEGIKAGTDPAVESLPEVKTRTSGHIADEIRSCTSCSLHMKRLISVPGQGGERPRILFVGGWLAGEEETRMSAERIFGSEEDIMISRMLSAMKLPPEKAFITNIIKCAVPHTCQPTDENINTCISFLLRQIMVLAPEIICTMGNVATRALLKNAQPLSQLRGKFYPFAVSDQISIPIIPTYHPTFLIRNPELKRATWEDLQSIAKQLKL
jgi:uracil-DNA glycosylase